MSASVALLLAIAVPMLGAVLIAVTGKRPDLREAVTTLTSLALFALVIRVVTAFYSGEVIDFEVLSLFSGLSIAFHVEPLSIVFALVASGLWIITSIYAIGYMRGNNEKFQTRFYACFAIALGAAMGVAFSANLLTLFIFYEVLTLSTYPLVAHKGDEKARSGARTYLAILLVTSIALLLPAVIWVYVAAGTLDFVPGGVLSGTMGAGPATILLLLFAFGVGKAAVMPVHRWLPAAMVAPTPVSALLHAVAVVKAGVFTITKVSIYTFGTDFMAEVPMTEIVIFMAGFTVVAASCVALRQTNLKRLLAYSTVAQLSYVVIAAMLLAPVSKIGAALHIAAHAVGKITLFFTAGAIYTASKKTELPQLHGIARRMPWTMTAFTIGALSMIGVPPTAGFVSKWYIFGGAWELENYYVVIVLMVSTALNAAYFLPIIFNAFFGKEQGEVLKPHGEAPLNMVTALMITATMTLLFFFLSGPLIDLEYQLAGGVQ